MIDIKYSNNKQMKLSHLFGLLLVINIIFNSGYALSTTSQGQILSLLLLFFSTLLLFLKYGLRTNLLEQKIDLTYGVFLFFILIYACSALLNIGVSTFNSFLKPILFVIFGYFITRAVNFNSFVRYFLLIMKILCFISIIAYILVIKLGINLSLPLVTNYNGAIYHNGLLFFFLQELSGISHRIMSVFWEPGLFASIIIIAMVFEISFNSQKTNIVTMILFCITLFLTKSTAGILLLPLVLIISFSKVLNRNRILVSLILILITLILFAIQDSLLNWLLTVNNPMFSKLILDDHVSKSVRLESPIVNLKIFLEYPIFGAGFSHANQLYTQITSGSQTSTSTFYMAALGFPGISFTFLWIFSLLKNKKLNFIMKIAFISIMLLILNKEPHNSILFTHILLFYLLKEASIPRDKLIRRKI
jgi:hypothetical protein